jgi:uncharacterized membrane protein YcjF (UPF0283 family)
MRYGKHGTLLPAALILAGAGIGLAGLVLVSNMFGNTDAIGLLVVCVAGMILGTGVCHLFMKLSHALIASLLCGPLAVGLLFIVYWLAVFVAAIAR